VSADLAAFLAALSLSDLGPVLAGPLVGAERASDLEQLNEADLKGFGVPLIKARKLMQAVAAKVRRRAPLLGIDCASSATRV
jgi:hypothetical protein